MNGPAVQVAPQKGNDQEKAYQLLCLKLGIEPSEAPVVEKTGNRIVFLED